MTEYDAAFEDGRLSMTFLLPLETAVDPGRDDFSFASYDPTYYIAIEPVVRQSVSLTGGAPGACSHRRHQPDDPGIDTLSLPEAAFTGEMIGGAGIGSLFATTFTVSCATN